MNFSKKNNKDSKTNRFYKSRKTTLIIVLFLGLILASCDSDSEDLPNIDLATESIDFKVEQSQQSQFLGEVIITGTLKNIGSDYISNAGQQQLVLYERPLGTQNLNIVAQQVFTVLDANQTIEVSYKRNWDFTVEFKPDYILKITYDPDILLDGNSNNDDSNSSNNELVRSGFDIDDLFIIN